MSRFFELTKNNKKLAVLVLAVLISGAVLAAVLVLATGGTSSVPPLDSPTEYKDKPVKGTIELDVKKDELPDIPEEMTVYELEPIANGKEDIERIARALGFSAPLEYTSGGETLPSSYDAWEQDQNFFYNAIDDTYGFRKKGAFGPILPELPDDEDSARIALGELEARGLLPEEAYVSGIGGERSVRYDCYANRMVVISRKLDGYPVIGPGMSIDVYLGTRGELIGLNSKMKNPVPCGKYKVKSIEEALADAQSGNSTMNLHPDVEDPTVTKVEIVYYADPAKPENKYLQPVYALTGPDTCIYVPAVKQ